MLFVWEMRFQSWRFSLVVLVLVLVLVLLVDDALMVCGA